MRAKFGCGPTVVSKKGGGYRQTDKGGGVQTDRQGDTVALYSRLLMHAAIVFLLSLATRKWWLINLCSN